MLDEELEQMGYIEDTVTGFLEKKSEKNSKPQFNPMEKTAFLKALKTHGNQSKAAHDLGFSYKIVAWHLRKDLIFNEAFQETLLEMRHKLEGELYKAGVEGRSKEAKMWLESHFPSDYRPSQKQQPKKDKKNTEIDRLYDSSL